MAFLRNGGGKLSFHLLVERRTAESTAGHDFYSRGVTNRERPVGAPPFWRSAATLLCFGSDFALS
jgi:hypothetical protein